MNEASNPILRSSRAVVDLSLSTSTFRLTRVPSTSNIKPLTNGHPS